MCGLVWFSLPFVINTFLYLLYFTGCTVRWCMYSNVPVLLSSHFSFAAFRVQMIASVYICGQWNAMMPWSRVSLMERAMFSFFSSSFPSLVWPTSKLALKNLRPLLLLTSISSAFSLIQRLNPFTACDCQPTSLFDGTFLPTGISPERSIFSNAH